MNGFRQWLRPPEARAKYLVIFAILVFVLILASTWVFPDPPTVVLAIIGVICALVAHGIAKAVTAGRGAK